MQAFIRHASLRPAIDDLEEEHPGLIAVAAALFAEGPLKKQFLGDGLLTVFFIGRLEDGDRLGNVGQRLQRQAFP